jgi:hypothetical protein
MLSLHIAQLSPAIEKKLFPEGFLKGELRGQRLPSSDMVVPLLHHLHAFSASLTGLGIITFINNIRTT